VRVGDSVTQGQVLGRISNFMNGGRDTTHHLHFQVSQTVQVGGKAQRVFVPGYTSLISAFRKAKGLDPAVGADGTLLVDPTHEYDAQGNLQPMAPGGTRGGTAVLETAKAVFVSWPIPNQTAYDGRAFAALSVAQYFKPKDPKAPLNYTVTGLPSGLTFDPKTTLIKGTIDPGASKKGTNGAYTVAIKAADPTGESQSQSFVITAEASPPELGTATTGKYFKDGGWVLIDTGAAFKNPSGTPLTFAATGLPPGLTINPATGRIGGRLSKTASTDAERGIYTVTVTASATPASFTQRVVNLVEGNALSVKERFTITAEKIKDPSELPPAVPLPVVAKALPSVSAFDGQSITTIDASLGFKPGAEGAGVLSYAAISLPLALQIDPITGLINGAMADNASTGGDKGSYTVTVIVDNGSGGTAEQSFVVTSRHPPPKLAVQTVNKTYTEGDKVEISIGSAFADDDGDSLAYSAAGLPAAG